MVKRIGLIGAGWVTQHHLDGWRALAARAHVVAVADPSDPARAARAREYGIAATYADAAAMLDREALDAVDVAAPREHHAPLCRLVAARGIPVLCQKPLAPTLAEAEALARDVAGKARLMVHENWRFRPHYRTVRRWIDAGRIGRLRNAALSIRTCGLLPDASGGRPALARQPFMAHEARMLVAEALIHHIDTLRFLLGPLTLDAARLGYGCSAIRGESDATMLFSGADGIAATLVGDFAAHGHPPILRDRLEIQGTTGAIRLDATGLELSGPSPERVAVDFDAEYKASYRDTIAHFLDRLDDGGPFETAPEDNLETLRLVERAYDIGGVPAQRRLWIMVAGPYGTGAITVAERESNLRAMNAAAAAVFRRGHVPVIGVNMALPVIEAAGAGQFDAIMMPMSLALAERCDAILRIGGASSGADQEVARFAARGLPVWRSLDAVPAGPPR
ncbi:MAG: Gfo/Idh/MocA family oxidoreductase [Alphaproteobacteria bacterium]|nr:Gfo/Idh/MocA family oxidoreductase [Alphaproteobacteria bacterium]